MSITPTITALKHPCYIAVTASGTCPPVGVGTELGARVYRISL